jgi:hypothetical protein
MEINFNPQEARFIRITLTDPAPQPWSIGEVFVYQTRKSPESKSVSLEELVAFLSKERIEYVYADIGLSAQITHHTQGKIKCLQEDYDITQGEDYSMRGYNGAFPYFNRLKKIVDFSLNPAFVVARENTPSFLRIMDQFKARYFMKTWGDQAVFYGLKFPKMPGAGNSRRHFKTLYWTGTHLLEVGS